MTDALIVGTAGHVDHGKTSLVRALTGIDLDDLNEEKARGITIALGFAPLTLPNGQVIGLVDVPGHERLVRTMVAGASGLDAVMLCVSGVEGVMPQTREHLRILGCLGVTSGVLVVTMADLLDAELLELAVDEIEGAVRGTFLEGAPTVTVSSVTGAGVEQLRGVLGSLQRKERLATGTFRMPVDRSFGRKGFGTVVTGTVWAGTVQEGDDVRIEPGARPARVRGLQVHGTTVGSSSAGNRTAINVHGASPDRGDWVVRGTVAMSSVIDCALDWDGEDGQTVNVLHGTAEVSATVRVFEAGLGQLRLASRIACWPSDRFVIRQPSPTATLGGGVVLDPFFAVARRGHENLDALRQLRDGDSAAWLLRAGFQGLESGQYRALAAGAGHQLGERWYADTVVVSFEEALLDGMRRVHTERPLALSVPRGELHVGILRHLDARSFARLLDDVVKGGRVVERGAGLCVPDWEVRPTPEQAAWLADTDAALLAAGFEGVEIQDSAVAHLQRELGRWTRVGDRHYLSETLGQLAAQVRAFFRTQGSMDPAAFKALSGQSRRTAIPLLEWLDNAGVTRRQGDVRVLRA